METFIINIFYGKHCLVTECVSYGHYQKILAAARQRGGQGENNYVTVFQKNDFLEVVKIATEI